MTFAAGHVTLDTSHVAFAADQVICSGTGHVALSVHHVTFGADHVTCTAGHVTSAALH